MHKSKGIDVLYDSFKQSIQKKLKELSINLGVSYKLDTTPVTILDQFISDELKRVLLGTKEYKDFCFYSEEDYSDFRFPAIILDPIDGTKEFVQGVPEFAVSLAIMETPLIGQAWVYNPKNHFEGTLKTVAPKQKNEVLEGLVSRSEWHEHLFPKESGRISLTPMGSIAYKLARLSHGQGDFVLSMRGKNIWDIAAGHLLAKASGFVLFEKGQLVHGLDKQHYSPPLIWCRPEDYSTLRAWAKI